MAHHFSNKNHKEKIGYDSYRSALIDCYKYNAKIDNLGKNKKVAYFCKICTKYHIGTDNRNLITFKVRDNSKLKIDNIIKNLVLVDRIKI